MTVNSSSRRSLKRFWPISVLRNRPTLSEDQGPAAKSQKLVQHKKKERASSAATLMSETTIHDLIDDCLLEVFRHLDLVDLVVVADVCSRFRQLAQSHFARSSLKNSIEFCSYKCDKYNLKILRIFGGLITKIELDQKYERCEFWKQFRNEFIQFIEPSRLECCRSITLNEFEMKTRGDKFYQELAIDGCTLRGIFLKMLPKWCPNLRELSFDTHMESWLFDKRAQTPFLGRKPSFKKLEKIAFKDVPNLDNAAVKRILKWNSQLKHIELSFCRSVSADIFRSIATLTPQIETLIFMECKPNSISQKNVKYLDQLTNLKALALDSLFSNEPEINENNHFLERLQCALGMGGNRSQVSDNSFFEKLSHLKKLKKLWLEFSYALDICRHLDELDELYVTTYKQTRFKTGQLLHLIRSANGLKVLYLKCCGMGRKIHINLDTYMEMVHIVNSRSHKTHLEIHLYSTCFSLNVSEESIKAHADSLTVIMESFPGPKPRWYI